MSEVLGLKNINMLSKEQYSGISDIAKDELYAISGSGFGFPSGRYDDLELGASGTEYVAPASGWFYLAKNSTAAGQYVDIRHSSFIDSLQAYSGQTLRIKSEVKKGEQVTIAYTAAGTLENFRFIYAEGE